MTDAELTVVIDHCRKVNAELDLAGIDTAGLRVTVFKELMAEKRYWPFNNMTATGAEVPNGPISE